MHKFSRAVLLVALQISCIFSISIAILFPTLSLGATFCVSNTTELQASLNTAANNGEDDTIEIIQGMYNGNFIYASTEDNNLTVQGGFTSGCVSRQVNPTNTVLDGSATANVLVLSCLDHAVEFQIDGLTLQNGEGLTTRDGVGLFAKTKDGIVTLTNNIMWVCTSLKHPLHIVVSVLVQGIQV